MADFFGLLTNKFINVDSLQSFRHT